MSNQGFVYFIEQKGAPPCMKIGFSRTPRKRLKELSTGSPLPLRLIARVNGDKGLEAAFHRVFAHRALRGEWYALDAGDITEFLKRFGWTSDPKQGGETPRPKPKKGVAPSVIAVRRALSGSDKPLTAAQLVQATGFTRAQVDGAIGAMNLRGEIDRNNSGWSMNRERVAA